MGVACCADDQLLDPLPGIAEHPRCRWIGVLGRIETGGRAFDVVYRPLPRLEPRHGSGHVSSAKRHGIHQPFEGGELLALDFGQFLLAA